MSWIPDFKIGLLNAWLLMLFIPLHPLIMILIDKAVGVGGILKKMGNVPNYKAEKTAFIISTIPLLMLFIYSIFLPLKLVVPWFIIGIFFYFLGLAMFLASIVAIAITPHGQPFTSGVYQISRHPMTFSMYIALLGMAVASLSWVFLLATIICFIFVINQIKVEERGVLETYGEAYREYLQKTPRWIGIPKSG